MCQRHNIIGISIMIIVTIRIGEYLIGHYWGDGNGSITTPSLVLGLTVIYIGSIVVATTALLWNVLKKGGGKLHLFIKNYRVIQRAKQSYSHTEMLMGRLFMSVLVCIGMFLVVEIISRKFISTRPPIEQRFPVQHFRHPRPYSMFAGKPNANGLNSLGYRGPEPQMPKPANEFRIFFLGGSTVYLGDPPISDLVQEFFQQNSLSYVKTYNFGVISSVSGMELARIVFEISDFAPDLIVMYNGANDIAHPLAWDPRPGYPFNFIAYEHNPLLDKDLKSYPTGALFLYGSNLMRYFFRDYFIEKFVPLKKIREECRYMSLEWKQEIIKGYVRNLVKAHKISKAFDSEFIAFFQPWVYFKESLTDTEQRLVDTDNKEFVQEMRTGILAEINQLQHENLNFVDLSLVYQENPQELFKDQMHTLQEAKPIVAKAIYDRLGIFIGEQHRELNDIK